MKKQKFYLMIVIILQSNLLLGQATITPNTWNLSTDYLGWDITPGAPDLNIKHELNQPIRFYTNAGNGTFNNQRMIIDADPGFVGIGVLTPGFQLDVDRTINIRTSGPSVLDEGYRINGIPVLQIHNPGNLFIGEGAGANCNINGGIGTGDNTFIGVDAGYNNTTGDNNTFVGSMAGQTNFTGNFNAYFGNFAGTSATGSNNTFLGHHCGSNVTSGANNTFVGSHSGFGTAITGSENTLMGFNSGDVMTSGAFNCFYGSRSGDNNQSGSENVFMGFLSGRFNSTGAQNVFIGTNSGISNLIGSGNTLIGDRANVIGGVTVDNSAAIGANTIVTTSNDFIIGNNAMNVGIGLSNVAGGPLTKLHIVDNTGTAQLRLSNNYGSNIHTDFTTTTNGNLKINSSNGLVGINLTAANPANTLEIRQGTNGNSGLRFTNLNNTNTASINATNKILSVNASGDVVLVQDVGGGSTNNLCAPGQNIIPRIDPTNANSLLCSNIFNDFTTSAVGILTLTPKYTLDVIGSACFGSTNNTLTGGIHYQHTNTHPVTVLSDNTNTGRGLTLLRAYGNTSLNSQQRDNFRMFNDQDGLTHIRTIGQSTTALFNVSFDHLATIGATTPLSWLGYNTNSAYHNTVIKEDFNTNPLPLNPNGRLCVEAQNSTLNSNRSAITAINVNATNTTNHMIGIWAESNAVRTSSTRNIGGLFKANNITDGWNIGVNAVVEGAQPSTATNYGVLAQATASGSAINYGVYASAINAGTNNYGIYATASGTGSFAGWFQGNVTVAGGTFTSSDSILKINVKPISNASQLLAQFSPLEYNFDKQKYPYMQFPDGLRYGFYAQDIERFLPQFVSKVHYPGEYDDAGNQTHAPFDYKAVDYVAMIPLALALIKEQNQQIQDMQAQINNCCAAPRQGNNITIPAQNATEITLTNSQTIILDQNVPNPFETETTINYHTPENISTAKIIFFNNNGNVLKEVDIKHKGTGSIKVYATELTAGTYNYSLVADGKIIDTKKMVKSSK